MFGRYAIAFGRGVHRHRLNALASELDLPVQVETSDLLLVAAAGTGLLHNADAVAVGQIFDHANRRLHTLPDAIARPACMAGLGGELLRHWGNFAFFSATSEESVAYRDPSGSVGIYRCGDCEGTTFASDAGTAAALGLLPDRGFDQTFVLHWLQYPFLRTQRTGLEGISELMPGMLMSRGPRGAWRESRLWHPADYIARRNAIRDPADAAAELRRTAVPVVASQAAGGKIVLRLSGGLDSSIIAACLARGGLDCSCINFATAARDGDEREHARAVADAFGFDLIEVGEPEVSGLVAPRLAFRPSINPLLAPFERAIAQVTDEFDANLLIDGGGGDNLFCAINTASPAIDALLRGSPREARIAVGDIAARANCTIWEVVRAMVRRSLKARARWKEDRSFLVQSVLLPEPELHPWLEELRAPPGKREHVEALVHIQHFLDRSALSALLVHPLLAQPLLELCLRIPSWYWVRGGRDRAVARAAFADDLPASILQRRMKGSLQSMLYRAFSALRGEIRHLLLDGELAKAGLLDTGSLASALASEEWMSDAVQLRISELAAMELWLQSWGSPASAAIGSSAHPTDGIAPALSDRGHDNLRASSGTSRGCAYRPPAGGAAEA